uniref:Glucan endo-1,3-beta-glucosidase 12 n=1 Tax=Tanacetum cinerariifolium TaxID=118510 RepID=A0A699GXR9_TANCI|nr:glucan endo-1,3-beta-glucosidase 12 [Tanacetum cinerariifolium]
MKKMLFMLATMLFLCSSVLGQESAHIVTKSTPRKLSWVDNLWPSVITPPLPSPEVQPPVMAPASSPSPHNGFNLPPCNPYPSPYPHPYHAAVPPVAANGGGPVAAPPVTNSYGSLTAPPAGNVGRPVAAPPVGGHGGGVVAAPPVSSGEAMWCVAKPSVPSEKLQEAMDYACGAGAADCAAIRPNGSCYVPDSVVAHASYAFNSYWQKNKKNGGMCGFQGTAMLITSDPSYLHCHYTLG